MNDNLPWKTTFHVRGPESNNSGVSSATNDWILLKLKQKLIDLQNVSSRLFGKPLMNLA